MPLDVRWELAGFLGYLINIVLAEIALASFIYRFKFIYRLGLTDCEQFLKLGHVKRFDTALQLQQIVLDFGRFGKIRYLKL